jgi:hypothetical protein
VGMHHDMHQVGDGPIWCCSVCGYSVKLVIGRRPVTRECFGSFNAYVAWLMSRRTL